MLVELFFESLLNLGDDWEVDKIVHNTKTNEVDIFGKWIGKASSDEKIYDYRELR